VRAARRERAKMVGYHEDDSEVRGTVTIKISKDFGDWDGIERFQWDLYEAEVEHAMREAVEEIVGEKVPVEVDLVDYGQSEVVINDPDDVWTVEEHVEIEEAFDWIQDRIDTTDERFYSA